MTAENTRKRIRKKPVTLTSGQLLCRAGQWARDLRGESDRGCALVTAEMLSEILESAIANKFVEEPSVCRQMLGQSLAPLGTFAARINIALLLGLIGKQVHDVLHRIRQIRNAFAHEPTKLTFSNEEIAEICSGLPFACDAEQAPKGRASRKARAARGAFLGAAEYCMSVIMTERWNVRRLAMSASAQAFDATIDPAMRVPETGVCMAKPAEKKKRK